MQSLGTDYSWQHCYTPKTTQRETLLGTCGVKVVFYLCSFSKMLQKYISTWLCHRSYSWSITSDSLPLKFTKKSTGKSITNESLSESYSCLKWRWWWLMIIIVKGFYWVVVPFIKQYSLKRKSKGKFSFWSQYQNWRLRLIFIECYQGSITFQTTSFCWFI